MIFETFDQYQSSGFKPTVCIVGSGPAGVTLARKLAAQKVHCLILEAGGMTYSANSQDAYKGNIKGDFYADLHVARLRYFGGTSGHWSGWCRPMDEVDFEVREKFPNSGWPIKKAQLDPYAQETNQILEVDPFPENIYVNEDLEEAVFNFSNPPVRFGQKYLQEIKQSEYISVLLNSPVKTIVPENDRISHLEIIVDGIDEYNIKAKYYCLCTGGIENIRLLLWSNQQHNNGVVPHPETLGKYWMEHPHHKIGHTVMFQASGLNRDDAWMRVFSPTKQYLHTHGIGNFGLRFYPEPALKKSLVNDVVCTAANVASKFKNQPIEPELCTKKVILAWGQVPLESNRVELNGEKDFNDVPRVNLIWKKHERDRLTAETAAKLFGTYLAQKDVGRLKVHDWLVKHEPFLEGPEEVEDSFGYHHMGGTRMASSPKTGIVDANAKVFGVENLFVGGSSVFATAGHANPTYTIVQLALRLGDHIAELERHG